MTRLFVPIFQKILASTGNNWRLMWFHHNSCQDWGNLCRKKKKKSAKTKLTTGLVRQQCSHAGLTWLCDGEASVSVADKPRVGSKTESRCTNELQGTTEGPRERFQNTEQNCKLPKTYLLCFFSQRCSREFVRIVFPPGRQLIRPSPQPVLLGRRQRPRPEPAPACFGLVSSEGFVLESSIVSADLSLTAELTASAMLHLNTWIICFVSLTIKGDR